MPLPIMIASVSLPTQFTVTVGVVPQPGIVVAPTTAPSAKVFIKVLGVPYPIFSGPLSFTISGIDTFGNTIVGAFPGIIMPTTIKVLEGIKPVIRQTDAITLPAVPTLNGSGSPVTMSYTVTVTNAGQTTVVAN